MCPGYDVVVKGDKELVRVTHYLRYPRPHAFSIERLYHDIRSHMPSDIEVCTCVSRFLSRGLLRRFYDMVRALRYQGDVNHVTGDVHFIAYLLNRRCTILTIHDCEMLERSRGVKYWLLWFFWFWLAEKRCCVIVAISAETKKQVMRYVHCDPDKIVIVYNPVSNDFQPFPKPFNQERPRLLQIGTKANKNIDRVAQALSGLNVTLVIVGQLSRRQATLLSKYALSYENYVGLSTEALVDEYRSCDMLIFASTSEGFGLPIVEAQAIGRLVVTSRISSMPEVAGDAACLVDPFDVASIRAGIVKVIEDASYRDELVQRGWQNVRRFRIAEVAAKYADLYRAMTRTQHCR